MSDEATRASHDAAHPHAEVQHLLSQLQDVAEGVASTRTIDHDERAAALSTAHQLAHTLAQTGSTVAAEKAREIVATLDHAGLPQPERLQQQVRALAELLEP